MANQHGYPTAAAFVPDTGDLAALARAALGCQGCDLYENASQTVFGEGAPHAAIVLVGEQPGDVEDRQGKPFVGPAGRLLDTALSDAGIPRDRAYVTNAVKHFRWKPAPGGGKRRIHQKPDLWEVSACRPWLDAELPASVPAWWSPSGQRRGRRCSAPRSGLAGYAASSSPGAAGRTVTSSPWCPPCIRRR